MGALDDLPWNDWDEGYDEDDDGFRLAKCRLCGNTSVFWQKNQQTGKWELRNYSSHRAAGFPHVCKPEDRDAHMGEAFEDLDD